MLDVAQGVPLGAIRDGQNQLNQVRGEEGQQWESDRKPLQQVGEHGAP